jgi:hypothetical protein
MAEGIKELSAKLEWHYGITHEDGIPKTTQIYSHQQDSSKWKV